MANLDILLLTLPPLLWTLASQPDPSITGALGSSYWVGGGGVWSTCLYVFTLVAKTTAPSPLGARQTRAASLWGERSSEGVRRLCSS